MTYKNTSIIDYNNVNLFLCLQNDISKKKNKKLRAAMDSMRKKKKHLWGSSPLTLAGLRAGGALSACFSNMLRSSSSLFALWFVCENEGWRGR